MSKLLYIEASPRKSRSKSIEVARRLPLGVEEERYIDRSR